MGEGAGPVCLLACAPDKPVVPGGLGWGVLMSPGQGPTQAPGSPPEEQWGWEGTWYTRPPSQDRGCRGSARRGCTCRSGCSTCSTAVAAAAWPAARWPGCAARHGCGQGRFVSLRVRDRQPPSPTPAQRDVPGQGAAAAAHRVQPACRERGQSRHARPWALPAQAPLFPPGNCQSCSRVEPHALLGPCQAPLGIQCGGRGTAAPSAQGERPRWGVGAGCAAPVLRNQV